EVSVRDPWVSVLAPLDSPGLPRVSPGARPWFALSIPLGCRLEEPWLPSRRDWVTASPPSVSGSAIPGRWPGDTGSPSWQPGGATQTYWAAHSATQYVRLSDPVSPNRRARVAKPRPSLSDSAARVFEPATLGDWPGDTGSRSRRPSVAHPTIPAAEPATQCCQHGDPGIADGYPLANSRAASVTGR